MPRKNSSINHPAHYNAGVIEVIDAIESWKLGFHLGNVVKYVARADHKGDFLGDLRKAKWYLDRQIKRIESRKNENRNKRRAGQRNHSRRSRGAMAVFSRKKASQGRKR